MKLPGKNPGYGNRGKTNCVFPPFPQPLLLVINQDEKQPTLKTEDRLHKIFDATDLGTTKILKANRDKLSRSSKQSLICEGRSGSINLTNKYNNTPLIQPYRRIS
jgi:hypothetical protein